MEKWKLWLLILTCNIIILNFFCREAFLIKIVCRYYEGQFTSISEMDVEDELETPEVRLTEAAEKVHPCS